MLIDGKTELEFAIQALEDIANPIAALQRYAKAQGRQLDGNAAVQLSKDPGYLKGMASDALATLRRPAPPLLCPMSAEQRQTVWCLTCEAWYFHDDSPCQNIDCPNREDAENVLPQVRQLADPPLSTE